MKTFYTTVIFFIFLFVVQSNKTYSQYQTPAKSPDDAVNQTYQVGTLPGAFGLAVKGATTYSIPLTVAPGTAGLMPSLAVSYNSQSKNGILGVGWELNGLSEITRVNRNYYYDGTVSNVDLTMNDAYALDSVRLILISGTHGTEGAVYGAEIESFNKIIAHGAAGNGPLWFEVITKNGNTLEYGHTDDSRVVAPYSYTVFRWQINKITDPNGNYIEFIYDGVLGQSVISQIRYTGNSQNGLSPYNKVSFTYITKNDPSFYYLGGSKIPETKLLTAIRVETMTGTLIREYTFKYFYDFYTHLNEIYETGSDASRTNSTIFGWGTTAAAITNSQLPATPKYKYFHGDFNGDGMMDLLSVVRKSSYSPSDLWTLQYNESPLGTYTGNLSSTFKDFVVVDVNGDGKDEVLWRRRKTVPTPAEVFDLYTFNGSILTLINNDYLAFYNADPAMTLWPADFDGDGDIDYMALKPDKNVQDFWGFQPIGANPNFNTPNVVQIIDFNGDKKSDILVIKNSNSYIYSYNPVSKYWETIYTSTSFPISTDRIYPGDFNGDKKTDILYYRSGWNLKFSTGISFATSSIVPPLRNYDPGASLTDNNYYIGDFNGDGKDDIAEMYISGSSKKVDVYYSKGDGTTLKESNSYYNVGLDESYFKVVDYNSDGQKDLWRYDYNSISSTPYISYFHKKERRDLIQATRNGIGYKTTISYENLNYRSYNYIDGWTYLLTRGTAETFPLQDYVGPRIVVNQTSESNGLGQSNITKYSYEGAKRHWQGKGFLGCIKSIGKNYDENIKTYSIFNLDRNYFLMRPQYIATFALVEVDIIPELMMKVYSTDQIINLLLKQSTSVDTVISFGNKRIFISNCYTTNCDVNAQKYRSTQIRYDNEGNIVFSRTRNSYSSLSPVHFTQTDSLNYDSFGGYGIKNRLTRNSATSIYTGQQPFIQISSYSYDNKGNLISQVSNPGLPEAVTKNYYLNNFGLPDSVNALAQGLAPRTIRYIYDATKRFILNETNPIGQTIRKYYNNMTGNIDTLYDIGNLLTTYTYDGLGRNIKIKTPDGIETTTSYTWSYNGYTITTSRPGTPTSYVKYDILNREIENMVQGQFSPIYRSKTYNAAGYLIRESPYGDGKLVDYSYDQRGMLDTITYNETLKTYIEYVGDNLMPEIHYPDNTTKKIIKDALGNIITIEENGSEAIVYTYNSLGKPQTITSLGSTITFGYDDYGRQTSINNPNSGITRFQYDNLGQMIRQIDSRNDTIAFNYDKIGRRQWFKAGGEKTLYNYYSSGNNNGKPESLAIENGPTQSYRYDGLGRLVRLADSIPGGINMVTQYCYDTYGHNTSITYPSGITINNVYDSNNRGYLSEIWRGSEMLWKLNSSNSRGQPVNYNLGAPANGLQTSFTYDAQGRVSGITTGQMKQTLSFDQASGNLMSRDYRIVNNPSGLTEDFEYDQLNRLIKSVVTGQDSIMVGYSPNGNITNKSDAGSYTYDATQINAVTDISGNSGSISLVGQTIEYNSFNLTTNIFEGDSSYSILYNPLNQRIKTVYSSQPGTNVTKYYSGSYEKRIMGGVTKETHYISSPFGLVAIIVKQGETIQTYFTETDHLGSIIGLLNADKSYADRASFNAWGRRRNPTNWSYQNVPVPQITERGYTGHEHLDQFGLINMNGRMYGPVVGRFLGVDPVVQTPDFSQSFNGYSYCRNNPLTSNDPTGYVVRQLPEYEGYSVACANLALRLIYARAHGATGDDCRDIIDDLNWRELLMIDYWNEFFDGGYEISFGEGKPKIKVWFDLTPETTWDAKLRIIVRVYGKQYSQYNFIQSMTRIQKVLEMRQDWTPDPTGFYYTKFDLDYYSDPYWRQGSDSYFDDAPNAVIFDAQLTICGQTKNGWEEIGTIAWGYNATSRINPYVKKIMESNPTQKMNLFQTILLRSLII